MFTHLTKVGQLFTVEGEWFNRNLMGALAEAGVDPLRVMNDFIHEQGREFFWSLRMNDTHDSQGGGYSAEMFAANDFKQANPQYLLATPETRPRYGGWSAVDFAEPEIRDLTFRFVEESVSTTTWTGSSSTSTGIRSSFTSRPAAFPRAAWSAT